ncbi:MAG: DEAD/DEAH box helicase [Acidimicrobiia bacterium]
MQFADLRPELVRALDALGYEEPTPIQEAAIPALLRGGDVVGRAATGTGKTAAFALPILERLDDGHRSIAPVALVLVPTRELALQVNEAFTSYGQHLGARVLAVYGGAPIGKQWRTLETGVDVVVATPGRALDHLRRGSLSLDDVRTVVLDEADEMFERGFAEDIEAILEAVPATRQTVLFSATMPPRIDGMIRRHLREPERIEIAAPAPVAGEAPKVTQKAYVVRRADRAAALGRILELEAPVATLVFCRTRIDVDELTEQLNARGYRAEALHGGLGQEARDRVMGRLRAGTAELLIATDVAARGLDVDILSHVVNAELPSSPEIYTHRIGRVGRAGRDGVAISLFDPRQHNQLQFIERITGNKISIEALPTVAQLRAAQFGRTLEEVRELLVAGGFDSMATGLDQLLDEHDPAKVAMAALHLATARASERLGEEEIEDLAPRLLRKRERPDRTDRFARADRGDRGNRFERGERVERPARFERPERAERDGFERRPRPAAGGMTKVFIGAGHNVGLRPKDLVGAIANEAGLRGADVGGIDISERFTLVEVPADRADDVISALRSTTIKGSKPTVRRERFGEPAPRRAGGQAPFKKKPFNEATTRSRSAKQPKWS